MSETPRTMGESHEAPDGTQRALYTGVDPAIFTSPPARSPGRPGPRRRTAIEPPSR